MKRIVASILALALLMSLALIPAQAAEEAKTFTQDGVTYKYEFLRNGRIKLVAGCVADEGVDTVRIPGTINGYSVERIGSYALDGCKATAITIPDTVSTIETYAFNDCAEIEEIRIPQATFFIEGNPFTGCKKLVSIVLERPLGKDHDTLEVTTDGALYSKRNKMLLCYPCSKEDKEFTVKEGTLVIGKSAFYGCDVLETIVLPETVVEIADSAFSGCAKLAGVTLPESLLSIGAAAFEKCVALLNVSIPSQVARIEDGTFAGCEVLEAVTLPEKLTFIGAKAFADCAALPEIHVLDNVNAIGAQAFSGCKALKNAFIPAAVTEIGDDAFEGCSVQLQLHVGPYSFAEIYARIYSLNFTYDKNDDFLKE